MSTTEEPKFETLAAPSEQASSAPAAAVSSPEPVDWGEKALEALSVPTEALGKQLEKVAEALMKFEEASPDLAERSLGQIKRATSSSVELGKEYGSAAQLKFKEFDVEYGISHKATETVSNIKEALQKIMQNENVAKGVEEVNKSFGSLIKNIKHELDLDIGTDTDNHTAVNGINQSGNEVVSAVAQKNTVPEMLKETVDKITKGVGSMSKSLSDMSDAIMTDMGIKQDLQHQQQQQQPSDPETATDTSTTLETATLLKEQEDDLSPIVSDASI